MCVAKLYDINPELVEDQGFLEILRDMLGDANPLGRQAGRSILGSAVKAATGCKQ
eukprot:Skav214263  [mRNA]  locus=scaffold2045:554563:556134:- [translate_table: standard]